MKPKTYKLDNEGITAAINDVQNVLKKKKHDNKKIINTSYLIEESLLFYQSIFGTEKEFQISLRLFIIHDIRVIIEGESKEFVINEEDSYLTQIYNMFGPSPSWSYKKGRNILNIPFPKSKPSQIIQLLLVILLVAIICFIAQFVPSDIITAVQEGIVTPTKDFLLDILIGFACPVIFFSVFFGILNVSDLATFKNSGAKIIKAMLMISAALLVIVALCGLPFLNFGVSDQSNVSIDAGKLYELIIGMIPTNPIKPFIECNAVQIIILAIVFAILCMILSEKIKLLKKVLFQASLLFEKLLNIILAALPLIMFFVLTDAFIKPDLSLITSSLGLVIFCAAGFVVMFILQVLLLKIVSRVSIIEYFKNAKESLLIALTTASSMAAYPSNLKLCKDFLKIDANLTKFGIPICQVLYCPTLALVLCATGYFGSIQAGTPVNVTWVVGLIITSLLLSFATPPVPGGTLAILTLLVSSFSIPNEFIAIASSISIFMDFPSTCINVQGFHTVLATASSKINKKKRK